MSAPVEKRNTLGSDSLWSGGDLPETLHDVLDNPDMRKEFMSYLKARLANESLLFYESIELYELIEDDKLRQKAGKKMVLEFVVEDSIFWVNIPATLRVELTNTTRFEPETFTSAKREVFSLMSGNFLDSFRRHLQGVETESAPKLSFDGSLPSHWRSLSFEQLADSLGENLMKEEERQENEKFRSQRSLVSSEQFKCSCKKKCASSDGEVCCEKMSMYTRLKALKAKKMSKLATNVGTLKRRMSKNRPPNTQASETKSSTRLAMFKLFKRPSTTKGMRLWKELEDDLKEDV